MTEELKAKKKIILIDDDITALDIIAFLFEENGFEIKRFANGNKAVEFLNNSTANDKTDLVLVDLMMPDVNGIDTTKKIRSNGFIGPIVAFTALDDVDVHEEAKQAGCNQVVIKPYKGKKLLELVNELVGES